MVPPIPESLWMLSYWVLSGTKYHFLLHIPSFVPNSSLYTIMATGKWLLIELMGPTVKTRKCQKMSSPQPKSFFLISMKHLSCIHLGEIAPFWKECVYAKHLSVTSWYNPSIVRVWLKQRNSKLNTSYFLMVLPRDWSRWLLNYKIGMWISHNLNLDNIFTLLISRRISKRFLQWRNSETLPCHICLT